MAPQLASDVVEVDMSNMFPELERMSRIAIKYNYIGMVRYHHSLFNLGHGISW